MGPLVGVGIGLGIRISPEALARKVLRARQHNASGPSSNTGSLPPAQGSPRSGPAKASRWPEPGGLLLHFRQRVHHELAVRCVMLRGWQAGRHDAGRSRCFLLDHYRRPSAPEPPFRIPESSTRQSPGIPGRISEHDACPERLAARHRHRHHVPSGEAVGPSPTHRGPCLGFDAIQPAFTADQRIPRSLIAWARQWNFTSPSDGAV
jgi:hypothetical protein